MQISFVKSNFPPAIFSIKSSEPTTSAPAFLASSIFSASHKTAILFFFPFPLGNFTTVLKLKSPPLDCLVFILIDKSIDSSILDVQVSLTKSKIFSKFIFSLIFFFSINLNLFDLFQK